MSRPVISLFFPTMGEGSGWYLDQAIRSAIKYAAQPKDLECLIFSNSHSEAVDRVLRGFRDDQLPARLVGFSKQNEGVALAVNACADSAIGNFFFYASDDVYFLPGWDQAMLTRVRPRAWQYLTPRSIERTGTNPCMYAPHNFGGGPNDFCENDLLAFWKALKKEDVVSRYGPPFILAEIWRTIGGFDVGYWPGFGTDPDFAMSLARAAHAQGEAPEFLGVGDAGVYHFQCVTTARLRSAGATHASRQRFQEKWRLLPEDFGRMIREGTKPGAGA